MGDWERDQSIGEFVIPQTHYYQIAMLYVLYVRRVLNK